MATGALDSRVRVAMENLSDEEHDFLMRGVARWNERDYRQAAEDWEEAWFTARGILRKVLHGLYEVGVAWTLKDEGKMRGHAEVGSFGLAELEDGPETLAGLDMKRFRSELRAAFEAGHEPPAFFSDPVL